MQPTESGTRGITVGLEFWHDGQRYALRVPICDPSVSEEEHKALPILYLTQEEVRRCSRMLADLAFSMDESIEILKKGGTL